MLRVTDLIPQLMLCVQSAAKLCAMHLLKHIAGAVMKQKRFCETNLQEVYHSLVSGIGSAGLKKENGFYG